MAPTVTIYDPTVNPAETSPQALETQREINKLVKAVVPPANIKEIHGRGNNLELVSFERARADSTRGEISIAETSRNTTFELTSMKVTGVGEEGVRMSLKKRTMPPLDCVDESLLDTTLSFSNGDVD